MFRRSVASVGQPKVNGFWRKCLFHPLCRTREKKTLQIHPFKCPFFQYCKKMNERVWSLTTPYRHGLVLPLTSNISGNVLDLLRDCYLHYLHTCSTQLRAVKGMYKRNFLAGLGFGFASGMMFLGILQPRKLGKKRLLGTSRFGVWQVLGEWVNEVMDAHCLLATWRS